jgi:hypothetical protein
MKAREDRRNRLRLEGKDEVYFRNMNTVVSALDMI